LHAALLDGTRDIVGAVGFPGHVECAHQAALELSMV
jgi:hypothetical protein